MNNVVLSKWRGSLPILETSNMGANGDCCVVDGHNASSTQSTTKHVYVVTYPPPHLGYVLTKDAASY